MTRLVWTRERPTVPGYYWRRELPRPGLSDGEPTRLVRVVDWGGELCVGVGDVRGWDGEWAGPIPMPEEPRT